MRKHPVLEAFLYSLNVTYITAYFNNNKLKIRYHQSGDRNSTPFTHNCSSLIVDLLKEENIGNLFETKMQTIKGPCCRTPKNALSENWHCLKSLAVVGFDGKSPTNTIRYRTGNPCCLN